MERRRSAAAATIVEAKQVEEPVPKESRSEKQCQHGLLSWHSLPAYMRDNEYIVRGYRADLPLHKALLSVFQLHNETLNIWTHLLGFVLFLGFTIYAARTWHVSDVTNKLPSLSGLSEELAKERDWEGCYRRFARVSSLMWRLDYAGIAVMVATSMYPPIYYSFMCTPSWKYFYLITISLLGVSTLAFTLIERFQTPPYRTVRAGLFICLGSYGVIPCLHKLIQMPHIAAVWHTTFHELLMGALYIIGAVIYAMRIPERWRPGKFDIFAASHQIFHVFVVAAAYTHYCAGLVYLKWRDTHKCDGTLP
eukprot:jgi/Chlat1/7152/Chrsp57S06822